MKYPSIKPAAAEQIAHARLSNQHVDTIDLVQWKTTPDKNDDPLDIGGVRAIGEELTQRVATTDPTAANRDALEGEFSPHLFDLVQPLPIEVLDDSTFWAFLSIECLYDFVAWRENLSGEGANKYYDGRNSSECVALRMYHRGRLVSPDSQLATAIPRSTDFWRSHIIRVQTSSAPDLAKALAESQAANRMMTNDLRELAKRVNRLWTNVSMHDYSIEEARILVAQQRQELEESTD